MTQSIWETYSVPKFTTLQRREILETDVCIVGTGIGGMTAAYQLAQSNKELLVLSDKELGAGETSKTTAQINTFHDDYWSAMEEIHGVQGTQICYNSYCEALSFIEETISKEGIECNYEKLPAYLFATDPHPEDWLEKELDAAFRAGVEGVSIVDSVPGLLSNERALRYENQAQFHPEAYLAGLAQALAQKNNITIKTACHVQEIQESDSELSISLQDGTKVIAQSIVLATNVPIHRKLIPIEALAPYRSYVIAVEIKKGVLPFAQFSDNQSPYHYVRLVSNERSEYKIAAGNDCLLIGGDDHRVGESEDSSRCFERLYRWAKSHFPISDHILYKWSAQTIESFDGMPLIGKSSINGGDVFIITGDSGTGMMHATIGGLLNADLILKKPNPATKLFRPDRPRTRSLKKWLKQNLNSAAQYGDWLTPGEVRDENAILPGSGAIMREGLEKVAVYRSEDGLISRFSATCPHLKAIVRWNETEKSWDCPAHGSRFNAQGEVINGPALCGLSCLKSSSKAEAG